MLELARDLLPLLRAGETVATVTVAGVARSAPRGVGSAMAVTRDARVIGSISGGCVEADAVALSLAALAGEAETLGSAARFGFSDDQAFAAGLACGGTIDAVISVLRPDDPLAISALERAADDRRTRVGIVARGPRTGQVVAPPAATGESRLVADPAGDDILLVSFAPRPRLLLMGAGEHAAALSRIASAAGFAVTVCDTWELLVTADRFPDARERHIGLPHEYLAGLGADDVDERTAVCILTHDVRLDIPAIQAALALPVGFVGALGARATVARRADLLRSAGVPDADLTRLHSPLGLDLGGASPEETAVAALAEIVAARHGGSGRPLGELRGPLHRRLSAASGSATPGSGSAASADASCAIVA